MKVNDLEELLWDMGTLAKPDRHEPLDDATLRAYRSGALDDDQAQAVEARLVCDGAARARLAALGGLEQPEPPSAMLERLLVQFDERRPPTRGRRILRWPGRAWVAGGALAAALALAVLGPLLGPGGVPAGLAYTVATRGAAQERSAAPGSEVTPAYPDTALEIVATPVEAASAAVELGLYRLGGERLERLSTGSGVIEERFRGVAVFRARASDLLGSEPGRRDLLLVVATRGDLPSEVPLEAGEEPRRVLAAGGRRLVYPLTFLLESELPGSDPDTPGVTRDETLQPPE